MVKHTLTFLFLSFALAACGQAIPPPTTSPIPTAKPTLTFTPTITSTPTLTPTVSPTPFPTLSSERPYLLVFNTNKHFVGEGFIYDANGSGRQTIKLPEDTVMEHNGWSWLKHLVSPDGQWMAIHTGSFEREDRPGGLPITLKLLNLRDGTIKKVADVVTDGYSQKVDQLAEQLKKDDPEPYAPIDGDDWLSDTIRFGFEVSIRSVVWSHDGRSLAFAAQIDGLSSDAYLYELETGNIRQIEDSLQNVEQIRWSTDDQYIVFDNEIPVYVYNYATSIRAVKVSDQVVKEPKELENGPWLGIWEWLSPTTVLILYGTDTAGNQGMSSIDIRTGQIKEVWGNAVSSYAMDEKNKMFLINTGEYTDHDRGLYLVSFDGTRQRKILDGTYYTELFFRSEGNNRFVASIMGNTAPYSMEKKQLVQIDPNGKLTPFAELLSLQNADIDQINISPDKLWIVMFDQQNLFVYDKNDQLIRTIPIPNIREVLWRPDSQAIFYRTNRELYFLSIPDGQPRLIQGSCDDDCWLKFELKTAVWLP